MNNKKLIVSLLVIIGIILIVSLIVFNNKKSTKVDNNSNNNQSNHEENIKKESDSVNEESFNSKINIEINGANYTATLEDNETTRKLVESFPLDINMGELNGNEKFYYLDTTLPTNSTSVDKINSGDIMLYGSDCLVLFYESFNTSYSYTRIGKIDDPSNLKENVGKNDVKVLFKK